MMSIAEVDLYVGDCVDVLEKLPPNSVQTCVTSPPYYGLRDYGHVGQIGQEETPEKYIERLVNVFRGVWRVLKDDGTLWINLGDSYAGSNQGAGTKKPSAKQASNRGTNYQTTNEHKSKLAHIDGYKPKDLMMIPARVAIALQADIWYLRSEIIWHKPNPMPESVKDRPTRAHEMIYLLSKSPIYFYDSYAVLEPYTKPIDRWGGDFTSLVKSPKGRQQGNPKSLNRQRDMRPNKAGRNRRDVWTVTTKPYKGAHFATFPPDLIEPCILAGSREGDIVLDPFNGAGTTALVARNHNRRYIGIDINSSYLDLTRERLKL